jgi:hypothetical protein
MCQRSGLVPYPCRSFFTDIAEGSPGTSQSQMGCRTPVALVVWRQAREGGELMTLLQLSSNSRKRPESLRYSRNCQRGLLLINTEDPAASRNVR